MRAKTLGDGSPSTPRGGSGPQPYDLYAAFVKFSGLHVHRAVDPSFRLYYFERSCPAPPRYFHEEACERSRLFGLAPHDKLSRLLTDYHETQGGTRHVNAI